MKILLVLPASDALRVRPGQRVPRRAMLRFSIVPLTTVAALTPPGHEVTIVDENVEAVDFDADVDLVGVTFMTALAPRAYAIADAFRARGVRAVAGGFHPTFRPNEVLAHFDAVVCGEAENTWPRVVAEAAAGQLSRLYLSPGPCDPATIPVPRRELTARTARHYVTTSGVQTGRGCSHGCRYCSITAFHGRMHRNRPLEHVLEELATLPRDFMFLDDDIVADRDYARELFTAMLPLGKRWVSQASLTIADDPELLALARRAGCVGLFLGIESVSEKTLASFDKQFNDAANYRARLGAIRRAGIGIIAGMIVGADHDDRRVFRRTLRALDALHIDALQLNILTPLPGTPLFDDFERAGRIVDRDWSHYDYRHAVIEPARMTREELQAGADWLYCRFYSPWRIARRTWRALVELGPIQAWLALRLALTYRRDNRAEMLRGFDPSRTRAAWRPGALITQD